MITLWLIGVYFMKKLCDYMFPAEMKRFYFQVSLCGLRCFSSIRLIWEQVYNGYSAFLMDRERQEDAVILCIMNGKVMNKITGPDLQLLPVFFEYYDLILYKEFIPDNYIYKYQITRLGKGSSLANLPPPSAVKFLDITIFTNGKKYSIDFGINNFYVEGNVLCDKAFLKWYLKEFFQAELDDIYACTIMDANINFITLYENSHIVIKKEDFDVVDTNAVVKALTPTLPEIK